MIVATIAYMGLVVLLTMMGMELSRIAKALEKIAEKK